MTEKEKILFERLKKEVARTFLQENSALSPDISQWKGEDIVRFQEDLSDKVKGRVSEKWFYNYFRNEIQKLPRIDMLNLLSQYAGYQNWADFKQKHFQKENRKRTLNFEKKHMAGFMLLILLGIFIFSLSAKTTKKVVFCFVDENQLPVTQIKVSWILPDESEKILPIDHHCVSFRSDLDEIRLLIKSPEYKDIIINRKITTNPYRETIGLQTDVLALLLQHYAASQTDNWQKRREKLQKIIDDDAMIYQQWFGNNKGIELYDKEDFIAQLCVPNGLIKNIKILEIEYKNKKISKLRFSTKP